ncbi:MAG TPA: SufD family Fe-S cluster assembly protein [Alphaproteobacteria bacterium]|nr:SufD family Fe-S cluster assembly protein [Alphaproteobacteria bacterium]
MNYLWQEFNIKTFLAETIVYRDGVFVPELSTLESVVIDKKYNLPIHIIYFGDIEGDKSLNINIKIPNQEVFLTAKIQNKKPAFLNIFIKNTGKNSSFLGEVIAQNYSELKIEEIAEHLESDTTVKIHNKFVAHKNSNTILNGTAKIGSRFSNCDSDITFSALADKSAKIEFLPSQLISSAPLSAGHSASIYKPNNFQVEFLREAGLSSQEIKNVLEEAFINNFELF